MRPLVPIVARALTHIGACLLLTISGMAHARTTTFSDGDFKPADYSIATFASSGGSATTQQILSGGNPGAALDSAYIVTDCCDFNAATYSLNKTFTYTPSAQGAITSISFSIDRMIVLPQGDPLIGWDANSIIYQNGSYYVHSIGLPLTAGVWVNGSQSSLLASDYNLITDLTTRTIDSTQHPDFSGGTMIFGTDTGLTGGGPPISSPEHNLVDNLVITIQSVPVAVVSSDIPTMPQWALILMAFSMIGVTMSRRG